MKKTQHYVVPFILLLNSVDSSSVFFALDKSSTGYPDEINLPNSRCQHGVDSCANVFNKSWLPSGRSINSVDQDVLRKEFLHYNVNILKDTILYLSSSVFSCMSSSQGAVSHVILLYENGYSIREETYNGSITIALETLLTWIMNNRLSSWAENYNIYIETITGTYTNKSTVHMLYYVLVLHNLITQILNNGRNLYCLLNYFTGSFDYAFGRQIWLNVIKICLRSIFLDIMKSTYINIQTKLFFYNQLSDQFEPLINVKQEDCLSPLFFSIFWNKLGEELITNGRTEIHVFLRNGWLLLYLQSITVFVDRSTEFRDGHDELTSKHRSVLIKISIKTAQTEVVYVFRKGDLIPRNLRFTYNKAVIDIFNEIKHFDIMFSPNAYYVKSHHLPFGQAQKTVLTQYTPKIFLLLLKYMYLSVQHILTLFVYFFVSIMNLGSEVSQIKLTAIADLQFSKTLLQTKQARPKIYTELVRMYLVIKRYWNMDSALNKHRDMYKHLYM